MTYLVLLIFICSEISVCSTGITTRGREFRVSEGQSVELPCYVDDLQDEAAVVWKRGDEILFVDEESAVEDQRFQLHRDHNNFTLIIERVEPYDTATYICSITSPEQSIKHHLQVNVPPSAVISPDSHPLLVNVGENVLIKCIGSGNPTPVVAWSRKDGAMPKNVVTKNGQLRILKITNADSGVYQCSASNDVSSAYESIEVVVQSAPWVTADETYQPVRLGKDANITCRYDAEPPPLVDWLYNSFKINFSDEKFRNMIQYGTRVDNSSLSILSVKNIREDNFGDYTCRVANHLGKKEITIHVSGRPGPPILNLSGTVLSWRVQSIDPIVEYQIMYRLANDDTWQQSKSIRASKDEQDGDVWSQSEDLIWLTPGLEYEIQLKARNTLGWGSLARSYLTVTIPPVKETADASGCDQSYSFFFAVLFIVPSVLLLTSL